MSNLNSSHLTPLPHNNQIQKASINLFPDDKHLQPLCPQQYQYQYQHGPPADSLLQTLQTTTQPLQLINFSSPAPNQHPPTNTNQNYITMKSSELLPQVIKIPVSQKQHMFQSIVINSNFLEASYNILNSPYMMNQTHNLKIENDLLKNNIAQRQRQHQQQLLNQLVKIEMLEQMLQRKQQQAQQLSSKIIEIEERESEELEKKQSFKQVNSKIITNQSYVGSSNMSNSIISEMEMSKLKQEIFQKSQTNSYLNAVLKQYEIKIEELERINNIQAEAYHRHTKQYQHKIEEIVEEANQLKQSQLILNQHITSLTNQNNQLKQSLKYKQLELKDYEEMLLQLKEQVQQSRLFKISSNKNIVFLEKQLLVQKQISDKNLIRAEENNEVEQLKLKFKHSDSNNFKDLSSINSLDLKNISFQDLQQLFVIVVEHNQSKQSEVNSLKQQLQVLSAQLMEHRKVGSFNSQSSATIFTDIAEELENQKDKTKELVKTLEKMKLELLNAERQIMNKTETINYYNMLLIKEKINQDNQDYKYTNNNNNKHIKQKQIKFNQKEYQPEYNLNLNQKIKQIRSNNNVAVIQNLIQNTLDLEEQIAQLQEYNIALLNGIRIIEQQKRVLVRKWKKQLKITQYIVIPELLEQQKSQKTLTRKTKDYKYQHPWKYNNSKQ